MREALFGTVDVAYKEWLLNLYQLGLHNKVVLKTQPANSPDCNINSLGMMPKL